MKENFPTLTNTNNILDLEKAARHYARAALSENSKRAYASDWADFEYWCKRTKRKPLPATPDTVALYLTKMADHLKTSSLRRRLTALRKAHELSKFPSPTKDEKVKMVVRGILRTKGEAQKHASPTLLKDIQKMMEAIPDSTKGIRDKALLLLGFAGGFRRSELVALDFEDMALTEDGLIIKIKKSKTDQTGRGRKIGISFGSNKDTCPITALLNWLEVSKIRESALFRPINQWGQLAPTRLTDQSVRLILIESLKLASISVKGFSGHSLRAGFATVAAINGASEREIQKTTGHMNLEVLRRYIRDGEMFRENASKKLGL
jgi:site-specific recombinase XerD